MQDCYERGQFRTYKLYFAHKEDAIAVATAAHAGTVGTVKCVAIKGATWNRNQHKEWKLKVRDRVLVDFAMDQYGAHMEEPCEDSHPWRGSWMEDRRWKEQERLWKDDEGTRRNGARWAL